MDEDYFSEEGCTNQINLSDDETHQNPTTQNGDTNQTTVSNSRITEYDYSSHKVKTSMFKTFLTTLFSTSPMYWTINNMNREINWLLFWVWQNNKKPGGSEFFIPFHTFHYSFGRECWKNWTFCLLNCDECCTAWPSDHCIEIEFECCCQFCWFE